MPSRLGLYDMFCQSLGIWYLLDHGAVGNNYFGNSAGFFLGRSGERLLDIYY